jgi:hypothetical protein
MWESWDESELSDRQRVKYEITDTGREASYTCKTLFKVVCRTCGTLVHGATTSPTAQINMHEMYECTE